MPCNSDYMLATREEVALSQVACLLDELDGKPLDRSHWRGYHPAVYNRVSDADGIVSELCRRLQTVDVTKKSLEMQIWWRDHKAADKARLEREMARQKSETDKAAALSKLTDYERKLLGLSNNQNTQPTC
jgi:hypothetical protein